MCVYDPHLSHEDTWTEMKYTCNKSVDTHPNLETVVTTTPDPYTDCKGASALTMQMGWDKFKGLGNTYIYKHMAKAVFVFDGHNLLDHDGLQKLGL